MTFLARRAATAADVEFLYRLHRATMQEYVVATWGHWDEQGQQQRFDAHFEPASYELLMLADEPVGMLAVEQRPQELFIANLQLCPAYQRRGLGTQILRNLIQAAYNQGVPLALQVLKANPARRLYQRLGFVHDGETATHYRMRFIIK